MLTAIAEACKRFGGLFTVPTVASLAGAGLLVWGLWIVWEPLALIVPGGSLVGFGVWAGWPRAGGGGEG